MPIAVSGDHEAGVEAGGVQGEVGGEEVGVCGVDYVGGEEEGVRVGLGEEVRLGACGRGKGFRNAGNDGGEEIPFCALPKAVADFLVVEEGDEFDEAV
jgi:hypothetical protein